MATTQDINPFQTCHEQTTVVTEVATYFRLFQPTANFQTLSLNNQILKDSSEDVSTILLNRTLAENPRSQQQRSV